jgi:hypothetical protein
VSKLPISVCCLLCFADILRGDPKPFVGPQAPIQITRLLVPAEAQLLALSDLLTLPEDVRLLTRYVWIRKPSQERTQAIRTYLNRISRSTVAINPVVLFGGSLVRLNLLDFTERKDQLQEYIDTFELLRFDGVFNFLITPNLQELLRKLPEEQQPIPFVWHGKELRPAKLNDVKADLIRINAGHLDHKIALALQNEAQSAAVIVSDTYFEHRSMTSIQDDGPYKDLLSGLYYDFLGLRKFAKKGETDLDGLLRYLGGEIIDNAENRTAIKRSAVTGKPRAVGFFPTRARGPIDGASYIVITEDVKRKSIDYDQNALATLDRRFFKPDAKEAIWTMKNGMNGYALFDGNDKLQDKAPDDVVADRTTPDPHETELQSCSSCIRCHERTAHSGWQPVGNNVRDYLEAGIDVFGDVKDPNATVEDTLKRLAGQYKYRPSEFLQKARNQYQKAMLEAGGAWTEPKSKPTDLITLAAKEFERSNNRYWYAPVTPLEATEELGFIINPKDLTKDLLQQLLPPRIKDRVGNIIPADIRIDGVAKGFDLTRVEWMLSFNFAQIRSLESLNRIREIQKKTEKP